MHFFSQNLKLYAINNISSEDKYYRSHISEMCKNTLFIETVNMSEEGIFRLMDSKHMSMSIRLMKVIAGFLSFHKTLLTIP